MGALSSIGVSIPWWNRKASHNLKGEIKVAKKKDVTDQILDEMRRQDLKPYTLAKRADLKVQTLDRWLQRQRKFPEEEQKRIVTILGGVYHGARAEFPTTK